MQNIIKGKDLKNKVVVEITAAEIDEYTKIFEANVIRCRFYVHNDDSETALLVLGSSYTREKIADKLIRLGIEKKVKYHYRPVREIEAEFELKEIPLKDKRMELDINAIQIFFRGATVEFTKEGMRLFKEEGSLSDFPEGMGIGKVDTMSDDGTIINVFFDGDTLPDARPIKAGRLRRY